MYHFAGSLIMISSIDFYGQYHQSPSKKWIVGWCDGSTYSGGAEPQWIPGRVVLINTDTNKISTLSGTERPKHGRVADNGSFCFFDHGPYDVNKLPVGEFSVFDSSMKRLVNKTVPVGIYSCGISNDGRLAVFQTCHSKTEEDGNKLMAFDTQKAEAIFSVTPAGGWSFEYSFLPDGSGFEVDVKKAGRYQYDLTGNHTKLA